MRVGVVPAEEAELVRATLEAAGWETAQRIEADGQIALGFVRGEQRAVRVVTSRGVVIALDSHESDGIRARDGRVSLIERDDPDVTGDGRADVVVVREESDARCLALMTIDERGAAQLMPDDADELQEGACVNRFEDVDADGRLEAIVALSWPDLAIGPEVPRVDVALQRRESAWRADPMPVVFVDREREARAQALAVAREHRNVGRAVRLAVEIAAFAHLTGAAVAAQVQRYDAALAGLVLREAERDRVNSIRGVVASGWRLESR